MRKGRKRTRTEGGARESAAGQAYMFSAVTAVQRKTFQGKLTERESSTGSWGQQLHRTAAQLGAGGQLRLRAELTLRSGGPPTHLTHPEHVNFLVDKGGGVVCEESEQNVALLVVFLLVLLVLSESLPGLPLLLLHHLLLLPLPLLQPAHL